MAAVPSGAEDLANILLPQLIAGKDFTLPTFNPNDPIFEQPGSEGPLYGEVPKIEVTDLTTGVVNGSGVFDKLMTSLVHHLKVEYEANRISGAEYTKAYVGVIGAALQTATQFLLGKDQAYWQALLVQAQARAADVELIRARVELETAKVMLVKAKIETANVEVTYALTKMKIATEDVTYGNMALQGIGIDYTNDNMLKQGAQIEAQTSQITQQTSNLVAQKTGIDYTNTNILPEQKKLLSEQVEVQRAQTSDTRLSGGAIAGAVGKQKQLYDQQITSYKRDSELKGVKMWVDSWITQKTIDEGLLAPNQFTNANLDVVLGKLRTNLAL